MQAGPGGAVRGAAHNEDAGVLVTAGAAFRKGGRVGIGWHTHSPNLVQRQALLADRAIEDQLRAPPFNLPRLSQQPSRVDTDGERDVTWAAVVSSSTARLSQTCGPKNEDFMHRNLKIVRMKDIENIDRLRCFPGNMPSNQNSSLQ